MDAWKQREINKRWEILQGQTLNMAWQEICTGAQKDFSEKLEALKERYPQLLAVNAKLISTDDGGQRTAGTRPSSE